ncbi:MAG: hypothetical protein JWO06_2938, partial [Bacteroidota bacterium]|nr:hypothetical protein [Bacteroidota bacterium]
MSLNFLIMGKFTKFFLAFVFSISVGFIHAQSANDSVPAAMPVEAPTTAQPIDTPVAKPVEQPTAAEPIAQPVEQPATDKKAADTSKVKGKDSQNQLEFMKPDMESKNYNFYQRKSVSTPLMPRYDLDSAVYQKGKKKEKQQQSYLKKQYAFPAKPKDQWELGVNFGVALLSGNVKPYINIKGLVQNIGAGFTVRKAIGYTLSLRFGYDFMMMTGRNWQPDANLEFNQALHGADDPRVNYWNNPNLLSSRTKDTINMNKLFFYNYRTYVHEAHLEAVINLGNISYHHERNMVNFYLVAGVSTFFYTTYMDALDRNGQVYDFSPVYKLYLDNTGNGNVNSR